MSVAIFAPPPDWPNKVTQPGIAAERRDVVAHPVQREHQVEHSRVAGIGKCRQIQIAEQAQPMIERHHDHVAAPAQVGAVVQRARSRAARISAAVDVDDDRARPRGFRERRRDVEEQAVFGLIRLPNPAAARRAECGGFDDASPGRGRGRRHEAPRARYRRRNECRGTPAGRRRGCRARARRWFARPVRLAAARRELARHAARPSDAAPAPNNRRRAADRRAQGVSHRWSPSSEPASARRPRPCRRRRAVRSRARRCRTHAVRCAPAPCATRRTSAANSPRERWCHRRRAPASWAESARSTLRCGE